MTDTLDPTVAEAILRAWDGKKVALARAKKVVEAWLGAKGFRRDAWGNYIEEGGARWHFGKQTVKLQEKMHGDWRDRRSLALIDAANALLTKSTRTLGREDQLAKVTGHREARKEERTKRTSRAATARVEEQAQIWATKLASQRDPEGYIKALKGDDPAQRTAFMTTAREFYTQCLRQLEGGGTYSDGEIVRSDDPPFAAFFDKRCRYEWNEDVQGVLYTFFVVQREVDTCEVHIGKPTESGMTGRIDPISHAEKWDRPTVDTKGDGYISGFIQRKAGQSPMGVLFFITSHEKQKGAGSRMLDAWCSLMTGWGAERWIAQAVGDEGEAFIQARIRAGRLKLHSRTGSNLVLSCS